MKIYQSVFGSLVESSIEVSNIMKQFQQLLYDFITTFYVEDFFVVNGSKKLFLKLQFFSKMIQNFKFHIFLLPRLRNSFNKPNNKGYMKLGFPKK